MPAAAITNPTPAFAFTAGGRGKHFAHRNIPVLLCDTPRILLWRCAFPQRRDTIRIGLIRILGSDHE
jgi:hypothetical protein